MGKTKEFDLYEQNPDYSCGPASLVMVYQSHGFNITEEQIVKDMNLTPEGAGWDQMRMHESDSGFRYAFKRDAQYGDLMRYIYPIVCYVTDRVGEPDYHFSVV
jgi:predicted double-glycine peptidase